MHYSVVVMMMIMILLTLACQLSIDSFLRCVQIGEYLEMKKNLTTENNQLLIENRFSFALL